MQKEFKPIKFPIDESVHKHTIEWWYFNGHLKDKQGKNYAFMNCLFRINVKKVKIPFLDKLPFRISYFSHSLVSDLNNKVFKHRITPFSIVSEDSFSKPELYINYINPKIKSSYVNCVIEKINKSVYHLKNEDVDLKMVLVKKPLLEGGKGFIDLCSKTTYYYSLTNLKTEGRIKIKNQWIDVAGKAWMDHQWTNTSYSKDRWDWFSLQIDNGTEIICFMYDNGKTKTYFADISYPDNKQEHYRNIEIVPLEKHWTSPKSKAVYPLLWKIKIPEKNIDLNLMARTKNQEMLFGSINYWEGPLLINGLFEGKKAHGVGFAELVGYPSQYNNVEYIKDEIGKITKWFVLFAKNKTLSLIGNVKRSSETK